jgi:2,3-diketo-5-methylthio-1-phosphopentane phosphatase
MQLCVEPPSDLLLLFDFDRTITDYDAGERLCDELAPELTSLLSQMETPANFVPVTNTVLSEMQRRGVSRDKLVETLRVMGTEMPDSSVKLLRWAKEQKLDVRVLSDCNSFFISHILAGAGVSGTVKQVITNAAGFEKAPSSGLMSSAGSVKAPQQRLVIAPRHNHLEHGHHGCPLCPANLCKGRELDMLRNKNPRARVIYAGDGANDVCPALCLLPGDVV